MRTCPGAHEVVRDVQVAFLAERVVMEIPIGGSLDELPVIPVDHLHVVRSSDNTKR